jgi:protein required for attachment to host cells
MEDFLRRLNRHISCVSKDHDSPLSRIKRDRKPKREGAISMQTTWIIVADSSRGRIFEVLPTQQLHEIEDFLHPEGRRSTRELKTDAEGRYFAQGNRFQTHTSSPQVDALEHEMELFAKTLSERLEKGRVEQSYERLCVIAPPKFLGLLRNKLNAKTRKLIEKELPKDLSWFSAADIENYVKH